MRELWLFKSLIWGQLSQMYWTVSILLIEHLFKSSLYQSTAWKHSIGQMSSKFGYSFKWMLCTQKVFTVKNEYSIFGDSKLLYSTIWYKMNVFMQVVIVNLSSFWNFQTDTYKATTTTITICVTFKFKSFTYYRTYIRITDVVCAIQITQLNDNCAQLMTAG